MNRYLRRQRRRHDDELARQREKRRLAWVEDYAEWHSRVWLESLSYAEMVCKVRSGELDRPTLTPS